MFVLFYVREYKICGRFMNGFHFICIHCQVVSRGVQFLATAVDVNKQNLDLQTVVNLCQHAILSNSVLRGHLLLLYLLQKFLVVFLAGSGRLEKSVWKTAWNCLACSPNGWCSGMCGGISYTGQTSNPSLAWNRCCFKNKMRWWWRWCYF